MAVIRGEWSTRRIWPSRRTQGKIYGKQESCTEVIGVERLFYLKKQSLSRYVTIRMLRGVVALPLRPWRMDGVLGSVNSLLSEDLRLTENFPTFTPGGPGENTRQCCRQLCARASARA
jgi:hypothetical protein